MTFEEEFLGLKDKWVMANNPWKGHPGERPQYMYLEEDIENHCLDKERVREWFKENSTRPRAECQDCRRQEEARRKREAFRLVWEEFENDLGM